MLRPLLAAPADPIPPIARVTLGAVMVRHGLQTVGVLRGSGAWSVDRLVACVPVRRAGVATPLAAANAAR